MFALALECHLFGLIWQLKCARENVFLVFSDYRNEMRERETQIEAKNCTTFRSPTDFRMFFQLYQISLSFYFILLPIKINSFVQFSLNAIETYVQ